MAQFQVLRYLKKWQYLIVAVCLAGCFAVYFYLNSAQEYTATAVIQYTHVNAANGQNPDGSLLDPMEMISSSVISDVINELELNTNVEEIRSYFRIKAVIPQEETAKESAFIELGQEYVYNPTIYEISYTMNSDASAEQARTVLDSLLSNYFAYYCEKYISYSAFLSNAAHATDADMEYMDRLSVLDTTLENSIYYMSTRAQLYPDFFSAITGYSFKALEDRYQYIKDTDLARLNAYVLDNQLVKDRDLLLERYRNSIDQYQAQIAGLNEQIVGTRKIIEQFSDKALDNIKTQEKISPAGESGKVLDSVTDADGIATQTTYDGLINKYTKLMNEKIVCETRLSRVEELLSIFDSADNDDGQSQMAMWADAQLLEISDRINALYDVSMRTITEFIEKNGADNLAMLTNVVTRERMNISRYMMLAVVAFVIIGCGLAVVCGRAEDFIDYFLYADRRTGLPNRARCDSEIERHAGVLLVEAFCCIVFELEIGRINNEPIPRKKGDELLIGFARSLRFVFEKTGFIGYNDNGMFVVLAENCPKSKADELLSRMQALVAETNAEQQTGMDYKVGCAVSTADGTYDIRSLIRLAINRCKQDAQKEAQA